MHLPQQPLQRFQDIFSALNEDRGWFSDATPLRFSAITAITCDGEASTVAGSIRKIAQVLKERSGWFGELNGSLRFIVAAMLLQNGDSADEFMTECDRVRALFRSAKIRRGGSYEVMAVLMLRGSSQATIDSAEIDRFKAIFAEMQKHHWWITGSDDFPACGILVRQQGTPEEIGERIEAIYQQLNRVGFSKGNALQTAANLLCLAKEDPTVIASRYHALYQAFRSERTRIWQSEYDELAILSFLPNAADEVVEQVLDHQSALRAWRPRPDRALAFNLASSIALVSLVQSGNATNGVTEAKAMMDMQAIINAQQAGAIAATSAVSAASAAN